MIDILEFKTKIVFGKGSVSKLGTLLKDSNATKVCIVYGKGSIKKNGIFDDVIKELNKNKLTYLEFEGIEPNPRHTTIDKCAEFIKENKCDFILAVGGGSVIDAAKVIASKVTNNWSTSWDYIKGKAKLEKAPLKLGAIITLSGTASENNRGSVVTNEQTKEKYSCQTVGPIFAIEDPTYTFSVSKWQTASGAFDAFSHLLEQYFGAKDFDFADNLTFAMLKTLIDNVPKALKDPNDYEARSNLQIVSSFALNGVHTFRQPSIGSDWAVHNFEHAISALWDVTHGAGLALITPTYMKWGIKKSEEFKRKVVRLGVNVFNTNDPLKTIGEIEKIISKWDLPQKYTDFSEIKEVTQKDIDKLVSHVVSSGGFFQMTNIEKENIFKSIKI